MCGPAVLVGAELLLCVHGTVHVAHLGENHFFSADSALLSCPPPCGHIAQKCNGFLEKFIDFS